MMKRALPITTLFLDIGGVLLTDGWDHKARRRAAMYFRLKFAEMEDRHHLTFDTYEEGKLSLEEYLDRVVFHQERPFTPAAFRRFMFAQSKPYSEMIALVAQLKIRYGLKIAVVSNEARELNSHRIRKFKLKKFVDAFISSCFAHIRVAWAWWFALTSACREKPHGFFGGNGRWLSVSRRIWRHRLCFSLRDRWGFDIVIVSARFFDVGAVFLSVAEIKELFIPAVSTFDAVCVFYRTPVLFGPSGYLGEIGKNAVGVCAIVAVEFLREIEICQPMAIKSQVVTPNNLRDPVDRKANCLVKGAYHIGEEDGNYTHPDYRRG